MATIGTFEFMARVARSTTASASANLRSPPKSSLIVRGFVQTLAVASIGAFSAAFLVVVYAFGAGYLGGLRLPSPWNVVTAFGLASFLLLVDALLLRRFLFRRDRLIH